VGANHDGDGSLGILLVSARQLATMVPWQRNDKKGCIVSCSWCRCWSPNSPSPSCNDDGFAAGRALVLRSLALNVRSAAGFIVHFHDERKE
jgi:hypothetical protein